MVTHAQIIPARLVMSDGNATGIEELKGADVASRAATYTCRTTGVFPVPEDCSSYYLCQISPSGQLRVLKRTCYPNNYNPILKICSSRFECPQPYSCGPHGFLCLTTTSYAVCNPDNVPVRFELCNPGFSCNNKCNNPCVNHVPAC
jgi:hypothetical protein